jgi:hypothetical protein
LTEDERRSGMQRVRVGLTGLAVVLLIVALATAVFNTVDRQVDANGAAPVAAKTEKAENEPLADLGMAPGAPGENAAIVAPPPVAPTVPEHP